jgi:hypothetical protein
MKTKDLFYWLSVMLCASAFPLLAALPSISEQPEGRTVLAGSMIQLHVAVTDSEPVGYQWVKVYEGKLAQQTNATLVLSNVSLVTGGDYFVVVDNASGRATSSVAPVTIVQHLPETTVTAAEGARVSFSVAAVGRSLAVQWLKDNVSLNTAESLVTVPFVDRSDAGQYCVVASNAWGVVRACSSLNVVEPGPLDALHPVGQLIDGYYYNLEREHEVFFALGNYRITSSSDATNWTLSSGLFADVPARGVIYDLSWGNGTFVAVGEASSLYTSIDGVAWHLQEISRFSSFYQLRAVAYGTGRFVVAASQQVFTSTDATNWAPAHPAISSVFYDVTWGDGKFVLIGSGASIQASVDGVTWQEGRGRPTDDLSSLAYGNGRFVAVGRDGLSVTSVDGFHWSSHPSGTIECFFKVAYGNGIFLAITRSSNLLSSTDGVSWVLRARGTNALAEPNWGLVCAADDSFLVRGANNTLLRTDPFFRLEISPPPRPILRLYGTLGRRYRIEAHDAGSPFPQWQFLDSVVPVASPQIWTDPQPHPTSRLYRAIRE